MTLGSRWRGQASPRHPSRPRRLFPRVRGALSLVVFLGAALFAAPAGAQDAAAQPPTAQASGASDGAAVARSLFDTGRVLLKSGQNAEASGDVDEARNLYEQAAAKFGESLRLDPGGGTLLNLALAHRLAGKTASAWAEYNEALRRARGDGRADRERLAQAAIDELTPHLSHLTVTVPKGVRVPGLEVRRNGVIVGEPAWGEALPVDPGEQRIEATAPGKLPWKTKQTVALGAGRNAVVIPSLADAPRPMTTGVVPEARDRGPGSRRAAGYVTMGVGMAAATVATFLGLTAISKAKDAEHACYSGAYQCNDQAAKLTSQGRVAADWSTALFATGFAAVASGVVLVLTGREPRTTGQVGLGPEGVVRW